jgi:ABC-2 type transport system permease protein
VIALLRTEFVKALQRTRTLVIGLGLVALPTLIVFAVHVRAQRNRPENVNSEGFFRLARQSGLLVPAAVLEVMSGFLLIVIAGMFAGDSVAGDAGWGNLRYVLMRPVRRSRLLLAKTFVAGTMIWVSTVLVTLTALIGGLLLFGVHDVVVPAFFGGDLLSTFRLTTSMLIERLALSTVYVAFGFSALLALGVFFSTLTDTAAGAIGATVAVYVVSEILDGITQLGVVRYAFPTHYLTSWEPLFTRNLFPHDMIVGAVVQVVYVVVFLSAAIVWFGRKDIRS